MTLAEMQSGKDTQVAPSYNVPPRELISVEHPFVVKNLERAVEMLGGRTALSEMVADPAARPLELKFHPEDAANRGVISTNPETNNVLLKVTVPKRTNRKRKRGSETPFSEHADSKPPVKDAQYLFRSLRDNPGHYGLEPLGEIRVTNLWRAMPDFVWSLKGSKFLDEVRRKLMPRNYEGIKEWNLPRTYGLSNTETYPPPVLSNSSYTHNYSYRQNPAVKQVIDQQTGAKALHNTQAPVKIYTHQCQWDTPSYPSTILQDCPPIETQPANLQNLTQILAAIFAKRPVWTRRGLTNQIPAQCPIFLVRYALAYIAYAIRSGPWRDTYCILGQDPRSSPDYRKYQTILLQLVSKTKDNAIEGDFHRTWSRSKDTESHIFTGAGKMPEDGKVWQLCDMADPQIKALVDVPERFIRAECEGRYFGWYLNGTMSKLRVVLKAKVEQLVSSGGQPEDPSVYAAFLDLPEEWYGPTKDGNQEVAEDKVTGYLRKDAGRKALEFASAYRAMCRAMPGNLPVGAGRLSKSKLKARPSYLDVDDEGVSQRIMGDAVEGSDEDVVEDQEGDAIDPAIGADEEADNQVLGRGGTRGGRRPSASACRSKCQRGSR